MARNERTGPRPVNFNIDDPLPEIVLPTRTGTPANLAIDQDYTGRTLVFWVTGHDIDRDNLARAEGLACRFNDIDARLIHVAAAYPSTVAAPHSQDLLQLFDPHRVFPKLLGLDRPGIIVVDKNRRLQAVIPDGCLHHTLAVCRTAHERTTAQVISGHAPVLLVPRILNGELCDALIDYWHRGDKKEDAVANSNGGGPAVPNSRTKRRIDVVVQDRPLYEAVKQRVERCVLLELRKCLHFEAARIEPLRVGCYDAVRGGSFKRHRDNTTPYTRHRRFAMSLNLNEGYEGGALTFPEYGRELYKPGPGDAVVFSCSLLHEALPVTEGRRFGLFTFFTDQAGAAQEDAMIAQRGTEMDAYDIA